MDQRQGDTVGLIRSSQVVLAFAAITGLLYYGRPVLLPFVLAAFIFSMFSPTLDWLVLRLRFPRPLALAVSFTLVLAATVIVFYITVESIRRVVATAASYSDSLVHMADRAIARLRDFGIIVEPQYVPGDLRKIVPSLVARAAGRSINILSTFLLTLVFLFFLMAGRDPHYARDGVYANIDRDVRHYLLLKTILSAVLGVAVAAVLGLFGVQLAAVFGLLTFLLDFIPSVGPVVATLLPVPVILAQFPDDPWRVIFILVVLTIIQVVQGSLFEPRILGGGLHLNTIVVLLAIGFWGLVWGLAGAFLAVPLTAIIRLICLRIESLQPFARLLGGQIPNLEKH